jgi:VanZ family protein
MLALLRIFNPMGLLNRDRPSTTCEVAATQNHAARVFVWRLLTIAWSVNMFWMSTERFSGVHSESILRVVLRLLDFSVPPSTLDLINSTLRKVAHVTEYAILGLLVYRSLGNRVRSFSPLRVGTWCILSASVYSLTDELHQAFVPGRHASLVDCGIDTLGAAVAMLMVFASSAFFKRRADADKRRTAQVR